MNEPSSTRRRDWIKNATIVFLIIMLILTFFSNTIMNYSLPEVSAEYVSSSTITTKVRGTGTVSASDTWEVYPEESLKVISVEVKEGDEVQEGDLLFTLELEEEDQSVSSYAETASAQIKAAEETVRSAEEALRKATEAYEAFLLSADLSTGDSTLLQTGGSLSFGELQEQVNAYRSKNDTIEAEKAIYENEIVKLQGLLRTAQTENNTDEISRLQSVISINQAYVDELAADITSNTEKINELIARYEAQSEYQDLKTAIEERQEDLDEAEEELAWLKAKLADTEESIDPEVKAPVSGTVKTVNVKKGKTASVDQVAVEIYPEGEDYTMTLTVTAEQAQSLSVGDVAELQNSWYYSGVTVVLSKIATDVSSRGQNKILTFTVTGDVIDGQSLSISIGQKSSTYSYTVPNSAVREDSNGKFVLVVSQKSSPLGNRYYAERLSVEVLASDDSRTAVSGAFTGGEFVITTSTKPVEAGQLIRLAD